MASETHRTTPVLFIGLVLLTAGIAATALPGAADHGAQEGPMTVESFDGTLIDILVCKPDGASASDPVPVILHSHGWGGSRSSSCSDTWLNQGWGYVSISQRGFGASGGQAHVHDPDYEGKDNLAVIDEIATFDWVAKDDGPGGNDPVMGAVGGSYGGGYQFLIALTETGSTGETRLDALSPEITWFDLPQSLAPNEVVRSVWVDALYAAGASAVHDGIHQAFMYSLLTGQLPDGTLPGTDEPSPVYNIVEDFRQNSPVGWVEQGVQVDVPVLFRQGITDNLFDLNQGWHNFEQTLTDDAQALSTFVGYNGGHALPNALPLGTLASGDPCSQELSGGWTNLQIAFFTAAFNGDDVALENLADESYHLATDGGGCISVDSLAPSQSFTPGPLGLTVTPTGVGAPQYLELASGPLSIAGVPSFSASLTSAGVDQRAFLALAVGTSPAGAQVLSNNVAPLQQLLPVAQEPVEIELAGAAADLAEDENLYLVVSPVSDMFVHHGSRAPGAMLFEDIEVGLPVVS